MPLKKRFAYAVLAGIGLVNIAASPALSWRDAATPDALLHLTHGCHQDIQRGTGGLHSHQAGGCSRIAAPDPKLVRDKRGRWCQRICQGAFPYEVCELKNCRRSR